MAKNKGRNHDSDDDDFRDSCSQIIALMNAIEHYHGNKRTGEKGFHKGITDDVIEHVNELLRLWKFRRDK